MQRVSHELALQLLRVHSSGSSLHAGELDQADTREAVLHRRAQSLGQRGLAQPANAPHAHAAIWGGLQGLLQCSDLVLLAHDACRCSSVRVQELSRDKERANGRDHQHAVSLQFIVPVKCAKCSVPRKSMPHLGRQRMAVE